jgi:hypothetical protein
MGSLAEFWYRIERSLFPYLRDVLEEPFTPKLKQLVAILEIVRVEDQPVYRCWQRLGRKRSDQTAIARSFVAKAVCNIPDTKALIDALRQQPGLRRIVGWETAALVPSESTFSRAFAQFAQAGLGDIVHKALVEEHLGDRIIGHVSRDSTAIEAREKPVKRAKKEAKPPAKRGRPKQGEVRLHQETRLQRQMTQSIEEAIADLPTACDVGTKRDAKGNNRYWIGWKVHIDSADGGLPVNVLTTSASMHDSQAAIPMARQTASRVIVLYELMDAAYDADCIHEVCVSLGHKPIIDIHGRRKNATPFDPATAQRYKERSNAERVNSRLKDEFGGRFLRVRGHAKAHMHIMFGIIALFADQLIKQMLC